MRQEPLLDSDVKIGKLSAVSSSSEISKFLRGGDQRLARLSAECDCRLQAFTAELKEFVYAQSRTDLRSEKFSSQIQTKIQFSETSLAEFYEKEMEDCYAQLVSIIDAPYEDIEKLLLEHLSKARWRSWQIWFTALGSSLVGGCFGFFLGHFGVIVGLICGLIGFMYSFFDKQAKNIDAYGIPPKRSLAEAIRYAKMSQEKFHAAPGLADGASSLYANGLGYGVRAAITTLHPAFILGGLGIAAVLHVGALLIDGLFGPKQKELADKAWTSISAVLIERQGLLSSKIDQGVEALRQDLPLLATSRENELKTFLIKAQSILSNN